MNHLTLTNPSVLIAAIGWAQVVPVVLILGGAALFLLAIWRGQFWMRGPSALPTAPPPTGPASPLHNVMRDAEELTGLLAGQMDRQAARLEQLLAEADVKIRHLERLTAEVKARPTDRATDIDPLNQRIYEMADEGMPPVEIARSLKQQTGKVQLILALRRK